MGLIFRISSKSDPNNYHSIGLTTCIIYIMESQIFYHLCDYLTINILCNNKFTFLRVKSCHLLLETLHEWATLLDESTLIDFNKVFDSVPCRRLLAKLICDQALEWIQNLISDRKQSYHGRCII